jgi:hypothetical protein
MSTPNRGGGITGKSMKPGTPKKPPIMATGFTQPLGPKPSVRAAEEAKLIKDVERAQKLGSIEVDGVRRSARLINQNNLNEAVLEKSLDPTNEADGQTLDAIVSPQGGGRRRRMRGGGERWNAVKAFAQRSATAIKDYAQDRIGNVVAAEVGQAAAVGAYTADQLLIALMSVVSLLGGVLQFTVGTAGQIAANVSDGVQRAAAVLKDPANQKGTADAATSVANLPVSIAVAIAALTQGGLVSLTTVVAVILRSLGLVLSGPGRAAATLGFYVWFLQQDVADQKVIKDAAANYAVAARGGAIAAAGQLPAAAGALADVIAAGAAAARAALPAGVKVAAVPLVDAAQQVAAEGQMDAAVGDAAVLLAGVAVAAAASQEAVAAGVAEAAQGPAEAVVAVIQDAVAAPAGGRKTKKQKSKRRMTRRRKATKVMGAPVFIY